MRYIKPLNEAKDNWFNIKASDVLDFANNSHLAYLLDEGYTIDVRRPSGGTHDDNDLLDYRSYIRIINVEGTTRSGYSLYHDPRSIPKPWSEIKDYIIPFLTRFINNFGLSNNIEVEMGLSSPEILDGFSNRSVTPRTFKLDDVLNDKTTMLKIGRRTDPYLAAMTDVNWIKIKR
jgi:hypothetical protein